MAIKIRLNSDFTKEMAKEIANFCREKWYTKDQLCIAAWFDPSTIYKIQRNQRISRGTMARLRSIWLDLFPFVR